MNKFYAVWTIKDMVNYGLFEDSIQLCEFLKCLTSNAYDIKWGKLEK